jgi:hypothetical protein
MRAIFSRFQIVIAVLVAMLGAGSGLPGIAHALSNTATHVCTCATGGQHASCPVCNPRLAEHRTSRAPAVEGVPCGDRQVAAAIGSSDVSTLPAPLVGVASPVLWIGAPVARRFIVSEATLEPAIPPPRTART